MATASNTPQDTNYSQWFAEDVVNAIIVPPTIVPARSTILDHSWISGVSADHTNPYKVGDYDYIFGFEYSAPVVHCYGITVNPDIRMGANGSGGSSGSGGFANAFFGPMKNAVDLYAADTYTPGSSFQPGRGAGTSPLSMHNASKTLLSFKNWLDGSDGSDGGTASPGAAPTLAAWVKWLGSEQATWQGTAADAVYQLITELGGILTAWQTQLDGPAGTGSMPQALDDAAFALAMVGNNLKVAYDGWARPGDDGREWWHPENGIRAALTARGLIVGGMNGVWDLTYPTDRSGLLKGSETTPVPAGWTTWPVTGAAVPSMTIDQAVWYLRDAANPTGMLQTDAKSYWTWQITQLDQSFTSGLVHLAEVYGTSTAALTPLITPTLHPITVTPPVTPPPDKSDTTPPPDTKTPPPTNHTTPPPTTNHSTPPPLTPPPTKPPGTHTPPPVTPPPTSHTPPPVTPPNVHIPDPNTGSVPPVKLADYGLGGNATLPKLPTDPWSAGGPGSAGRAAWARSGSARSEGWAGSAAAWAASTAWAVPTAVSAPPSSWPPRRPRPGGHRGGRGERRGRDPDVSADRHGRNGRPGRRPARP
ncbi:hypothetical protein ACFQ9X_33910 [Catenulispora yoronensis]